MPPRTAQLEESISTTMDTELVPATDSVLDGEPYNPGEKTPKTDTEDAVKESALFVDPATIETTLLSDYGGFAFKKVDTINGDEAEVSELSLVEGGIYDQGQNKLQSESIIDDIDPSFTPEMRTTALADHQEMIDALRTNPGEVHIIKETKGTTAKGEEFLDLQFAYLVEGNKVRIETYHGVVEKEKTDDEEEPISKLDTESVAPDEIPQIEITIEMESEVVDLAPLVTLVNAESAVMAVEQMDEVHEYNEVREYAVVDSSQAHQREIERIDVSRQVAPSTFTPELVPPIEALLIPETSHSVIQQVEVLSSRTEYVAPVSVQNEIHETGIHEMAQSFLPIKTFEYITPTDTNTTQSIEQKTETLPIEIQTRPEEGVVPLRTERTDPLPEAVKIKEVEVETPLDVVETPREKVSEIEALKEVEVIETVKIAEDAIQEELHTALREIFTQPIVQQEKLSKEQNQEVSASDASLREKTENTNNEKAVELPVDAADTTPVSSEKIMRELGIEIPVRSEGTAIRPIAHVERPQPVNRPASLANMNNTDPVTEPLSANDNTGAPVFKGIRLRRTS